MPREELSTEDEEETFIPIARHKSSTTTTTTTVKAERTWADEEDIKQEQRPIDDVIELDDDEEEEEQSKKPEIILTTKKEAPLHTLASVFEDNDDDDEAKIGAIYLKMNAEADERLKHTNEEAQKRRRLFNTRGDADDSGDENVRQVQSFLENEEKKPQPLQQSSYPIKKQSKLYKNSIMAVAIDDDEYKPTRKPPPPPACYELQVDHKFPRASVPPPPPRRIPNLVTQTRLEMDATKRGGRQTQLPYASTSRRRSDPVPLEEEEEEEEEEEQRSKRVLRSTSKYFNGNKKPTTAGQVLFAYGGEFDSVSITREDLEKCRDPKLFLNDSLIDFYIKYLVTHDADNNNHANRVHAFTSFLFSTMNPKSNANSFAACYRKVVRWTSGVNLFEKTFLLFPVNQSLHWSLAVVYMETPQQGVILTLDSFNDESSHHPEDIAHVIRQYLSYEYDHRVIKGNVYEKRNQRVLNTAAADEEEDEVEFVRESIAPVCLDDDGNDEFQALEAPMFTVETMPLHKLRVPMQTDGVNCGLHLLNNASVMLTVLPHERLSALHMLGYCNEQYSELDFTTRDAQQMRKEICKQIESMANENKLLQQFKKT